MGDSGDGSNPVGEIVSDVAGAVKDTLSQGVKTSFGVGSPSASSTADPAKAAKDKAQMQYVRNYIGQMKANSQAVTAAKEQQEAQVKQAEDSQRESIPQFQTQTSLQKPLGQDVLETRSEMRVGRKGG